MHTFVLNVMDLSFAVLLKDADDHTGRGRAVGNMFVLWPGEHVMRRSQGRVEQR